MEYWVQAREHKRRGERSRDGEHLLTVELATERSSNGHKPGRKTRKSSLDGREGPSSKRDSFSDERGAGDHGVCSSGSSQSSSSAGQQSVVLDGVLDGPGAALLGVV